MDEQTKANLIEMGINPDQDVFALLDEFRLNMKNAVASMERTFAL